MIVYPDRIQRSGFPVLLHKPYQQDLEFIRRLWADLPTMQPVGGPITLEKAAALKWYSHMICPGSDDDRYFLIQECDTIEGAEANDSAGSLTAVPLNRYVGEASLHRWKQAAGQAELNIKVLASSRGQGYGSAALTLLLEYFFETCDGLLLRDDVATDNRGGRELLERHGFTVIRTEPTFRRMVLERAQWQRIQP